MKQPKLTIYKAKDGFRWRLQAKNGHVIAEGGEAYKTQKKVEQALDLLDKILFFGEYDYVRPE